jgi:Na+-driven multidrug efflux pump
MSWEYFYLLIEHHGERALAISNTMRNIFGLFGIFSWAFASATNTIVSNVIGQGKEEEVMPLIKRIIKVSFSISLVLFVLLNIWPEGFLYFFDQGEGFISDAIPVIRVVSVALLLMSFGTIWLNAVTGTGNTRVNLLIEAITIVVYCVYVYLTLEYWNLPITIGWISEWVYWLSMFTMAFFYMRSGRWKNKQM